MIGVQVGGNNCNDNKNAAEKTSQLTPSNNNNNNAYKKITGAAPMHLNILLYRYSL